MYMQRFLEAIGISRLIPETTRNQEVQPAFTTAELLFGNQILHVEVTGKPNRTAEQQVRALYQKYEKDMSLGQKHPNLWAIQLTREANSQNDRETASGFFFINATHMPGKELRAHLMKYHLDEGLAEQMNQIDDNTNYSKPLADNLGWFPYDEKKDTLLEVDRVIRRVE